MRVARPLLEGGAPTPCTTTWNTLPLQAGLDDECPVCLNDMAEPCITLCKHIFCQ